MSKLKTKSSAKKRFFVTGNGDIKMGQAYKRHNMRRRTNRMRRDARGMTMMDSMDAKNVKKFYLHI